MVVTARVEQEVLPAPGGWRPRDAVKQPTVHTTGPHDTELSEPKSQECRTEAEKPRSTMHLKLLLTVPSVNREGTKDNITF